MDCRYYNLLPTHEYGPYVKNASAPSINAAFQRLFMTGVVLPFSMALSPGRGFASFKCTSVIEYSRRCARDALIQASLEPEITSIEPLLLWLLA